MKKLLRTLMLAVLFLPFALQAQTLTVCEGTVSNEYVPFQGYNADYAQHNQMIYPASMLTDLNGETILQMEFYIDPNASNGTNTAADRLGTWTVSLGETTETTLSGLDNTTPLTQVYQGYFDCSTGILTVEFNSPYLYNGGNLLVDLDHAAASWNRWYFLGVEATGASYTYNNQRNFLPMTTFTYGNPPTCFRVSGVSIDASQTTSNSLTLTWVDTINTGATYNIYDVNSSSLIASGITDFTYTVTGLNPNTNYTFGIETDCGGGDLANGYALVSGITACGTETFPWSENFDNWASKSECWSFLSGALSSTPTPSTSAWTLNTSYGSYITIDGKALTMNLYSTNRYWAVTPPVEIMSDDAVLSVDVAVSAWSAAAPNYDDNDTLAFLMSTDNGATFTLLQVYDGAQLNSLGNTYTTIMTPVTGYNGQVARFAIYGGSISGTSPYDNRIAIDNVTVGEAPTCMPVSNLAVSNITANGATLTWEGNADGYIIYDMSDSTILASGISDLTYTVEYLNANTTYTFGVAADCGGDLSVIRTVTGRTDCGAISVLPFTEDFETVANGSYPMPYCWNRYTSAYTCTATYPYSYSSSTYAHSSSRTLYFYGATDTSYPDTMAAILPELDVTAYPMNLNRVIFWARTSSSSYNKNVYVYTMSDPTDLTTLTLVDSAMVSGTTHTKYTVSLENAPATDAYVALVVMKGDGSLYLDDLTLDVTPACPEIETLTVSDITADGATLSWTGNADSYTIYDMSDNTSFGSAYENTFTLTNLEPMTNYTIGVTANCGSDESPVVTVNFNTACTAITLPYTETFEANSASSACWSSEGDNEWTIGTGDYSTSTGAYQGSQNALITHVSTGDVTKLISPALDGVEDGLILNFAYVMRQWVNDIDELRVYTRSAADAAWQQVAEYTAAAGSWTPVSLSIPGSVYQVAFEYTDNYGYGVGIDEVAFIPMGSDYCFPISNLAVSGVTSSSVSLTWQENGDATNWNVVYGPAGFIIDGEDAIMESVTDTTVTIDNLTAGQAYDFYVQADCGSGVSEWSGPVQATPGSFTFGITGNSSITACDLVIYDNGGSNGNYSNNCNYTLTVYPSDPDSVVSVSGTFVGEGSYDYLSVYDGTSTSGTLLQKITSGTSGTVINFGPLTSESGPVTLLFYSDGSNVYAGFEATVSCVAAPECRTPYDLTASNVSDDEATISWTADEGANIELYYKQHNDTSWITVPASDFTTDNSYLMTNLDASTTYDVYVANLCTDDTLESVTITFTTLCTAEIAPYSETFAGFNTSVSPCWERYSGLANTVFNGGALTPYTGGWYFTSSNVFPLGHPKINIYGTSCNYWLVSPSIDLSQLTNPTLMFSLALTDYNNTDPIEQIGNQTDDKFMVIISTDNGTTWSAANATVWDNTGSGNYSYDSISTTGEDIAISLSQYAGQTIRIAFYGESTVAGGDNDLHIADVVVGEPVSCPRPNQLAATASTINSVTLSWTAGADETAWDIIYGTPGFDVATAGTLIQNVTNNPYDVTGLDAGTAYEFYVRANCGGGDVSYWSNGVTINTQMCDAADQCTYTFVLSDSYGDGWNGGSLNVEQNNVVVATLTLGSGESTATETLALCDNVSTSLVWSSGSYEYEAGFSIAGPDGTVLFSHDSMDTYTTFTFTTDCSGTGPVITDPTVATTAATNIAQTTATLNATISNPDNVTISAKGFEWKTTTGGTYVPVTVTGDNFTYNLTGLTANTGYTYKAFITYNGTTVYGTEMTFTTLPEDVEPCDAPTGLAYGEVTGESIAISWNASANAEGYNIQYSPQGGSISSASSTTNSYIITGLAQNTTYQIQVQANCGDGNLSAWSEIITVTTTGIDNLSNSISLYPNPANDVVNVQSTMYNVQEVEVIDVYGKVINVVNATDNLTHINVSGLANGMYFVRVTTDQGVVTKTFVKR